MSDKLKSKEKRSSVYEKAREIFVFEALRVGEVQGCEGVQYCPLLIVKDVLYFCLFVEVCEYSIVLVGHVYTVFAPLSPFLLHPRHFIL